MYFILLCYVFASVTNEGSYIVFVRDISFLTVSIHLYYITRITLAFRVAWYLIFASLQNKLLSTGVVNLTKWVREQIRSGKWKGLSSRGCCLYWRMGQPIHSGICSQSQTISFLTWIRYKLSSQSVHLSSWSSSFSFAVRSLLEIAVSHFSWQDWHCSQIDKNMWRYMGTGIFGIQALIDDGEHLAIHEIRFLAQ